ncbi:serine/threonine protein kinase [Planctomycetes bacterium Pla163]|uniref:Serine/threonine protein kinase n=1 Tax=Rohdeia mirabilis TaxID=2528008 RepID=A0A518CZQ0_9BACT|nr:serine/threonine protein kinase [Planctomycetes bacterium Pla163]
MEEREASTRSALDESAPRERRSAADATCTLLKEDVFGRVELVEDADGERCARRTVSTRGLVLPFVGRLLLARERRALAALGGLDGTPVLLECRPGEDPRRVLRRGWIEGEPLWAATELPRDWFERAEELVAAVHLRGVRHNDLHKEQNLVVRRDGRPALLDFQLASVHTEPRARRARTRAAEDLRHIDKHRRRYLRAGRPKTDADRAGRPSRSLLARVWRRLGKPLYRGLVRLAPALTEPEPRRASSGPWPSWTAPLVGDQASGASADAAQDPRKFDSNA